MRDFAKSPASQTLIVNDASMMKALVQFMSTTTDPEIMLLCTETFHHLAGNAKCREIILKRTEIMTNLEVLAVINAGDHAEQISANAKSALALLATPAPAAAAAPAAVRGVLGPASAASAAGSNSSGASGRNASSSTSWSSQNLRPTGAFGGRGYLTSISFSVPSLQGDEQRNQLESVLIHTRGVVSVTIDVATKRARIYTSSSTDEVSSAIIKTLAENDFPDAAVVEVASKDDAAGKSKKPGYVDLNSCANKDALVRYQRSAKKTDNAAGNGWFSSVTSYFW